MKKKKLAQGFLKKSAKRSLAALLLLSILAMPSANAASTWTAPEGEVEGGKFMNLLDSIMTNDDHPDIQWASDGSLTTSPSVNQSRGVVDQNDTKILNAKDGKIGVGTEDPSSELDVRGKIESMSLDTDVLSSDSVNTKHIDIESDVGVNAEMTIKSGSYMGNHWGIYQEQSDGSLKFWNGQNNAILDKNGKLGIGSMVTGPKAGLEIRSVYNNNSSSSQIGSILTLDAGSGITNEYARQIDFSVNGKTPARLGISGNASNLKDTSRFYINANPDELKSWESPDLMISSKTGHVGIGAEPDSYARLFVDGPTVTTDSFLRAKGENYNGTHYEREDSTGKKHRWSWYHMNNEHGRNTLQLWEYYDLNDNGRYCDGTDPVCSRMITISTGGNLGIGVSKPVEKLEVKGNIKANKIKSEEYCNDDSTDCKSIANIYSKTEADNRYYRKEEVDEKMSTVGGGKIVKISSNSNHNILLGSNGTVYAWGDNKYGQLGDGTRTDRKFPTKISGITNIADIAAGYNHTLALKSDGTLWAWGSNSSGELGDGTKTSRKFPTKISGITNIVDIAAGSSHTLALKKDGTVWAWGNNFYGQLGNGTRIGSVTPVKIDISEVSKIFTSNSSSYAVKSDGTVWAWGDNYHGQLGDGTTTNRKIPTKVSGAISGIIDIAASDYHSVAIKSDGTIYTWGKGVYLGAGENANDKTKPTSIGKISGAINVTAGDKHTILLKNDNTLYAWGDGGDYKLGTGSEDNVYSPVVIPSPLRSYSEIETLSVATDVVESKTSKRALCYAYAASNVGYKKHWIKVIEFDYIGAKFIKNLNTTEAGYEYSDVMIARSSAQDGGHMAQVGWCKSGWNLAYGRGTGSSTLGSPTVYDANPACIFRDKSCSHGPWGLNDCKYYADYHGDKNCVESDTSGDDSVILMCCKAYNE